ncbi:MAG TPA: hypothetical protein DIC51_00625 [Coxiellaceae bacterium]|nr:hypothetical protein [Coxiellaceae bacterium]
MLAQQGRNRVDNFPIAAEASWCVLFRTEGKAQEITVQATPINATAAAAEARNDGSFAVFMNAAVNSATLVSGLRDCIDYSPRSLYLLLFAIIC